MLPIYLLVALGFGVAYGIYEALDDDDDNQDTTINGTAEDDMLTGGSGDDNIFGNGGNDLLSGLGGNDELDGGPGHDTMQGGDGIDRIRGDDGNDVGSGDAGDDILRGAEGDDALQGGDGDDAIYGDRDDDWVDGGDGDDTLVGGSEDDVLVGGTGSDSLTGDGGDDMLSGGELLTRALTTDELAALRDAGLAGETALLPSDVTYDATDDGDPDVLDGGKGDDLLLFGAGDTATGGEGADDFFLLGGTAADPAVVMDFDGAEDTLVYVHEAGTPEPALTLTDNGDGTQSLEADGEVVAMLAATGLSAEDILFYERGSDATFVA